MAQFGLKQPMVGYLAISLSGILAVLGILVSLSPPPSGGIWHWSVLLAFIVVGLVAIGIGIKDRSNADASQKELKDTIDNLKDAVDNLTRPIGNTATPRARDPDTIYQNDTAAGRVSGARITLNESQVYFDEIENTGNLDRARTFEYRDFVLQIVRADAYIGMLVAQGGVKNNVLQHVVCRITGRVH
jgi:hypothetical protein